MYWKWTCWMPQFKSFKKGSFVKFLLLSRICDVINSIKFLSLRYRTVIFYTQLEHIDISWIWQQGKVLGYYLFHVFLSHSRNGIALHCSVSMFANIKWVKKVTRKILKQIQLDGFVIWTGFPERPASKSGAPIIAVYSSIMKILKRPITSLCIDKVTSFDIIRYVLLKCQQL